MERRRECSLQQIFLSQDDVLLHRTIFPKAYSIALLANHADAGLGFGLFGWRGGIVQNRGFHISGAVQPEPEITTRISTETRTRDQAHASHCPK